MRKNQTAMAIGFFLGLVFVLCQQLLIIFAVFVEQSQLPDQSTMDIQAYNALASFSFLLFIIYSTFGILLAVFRDDIIKVDNDGYYSAANTKPGMYFEGEAFDDIPPQEEDDDQL